MGRLQISWLQISALLIALIFLASLAPAQSEGTAYRRYACSYYCTMCDISVDAIFDPKSIGKEFSKEGHEKCKNANYAELQACTEKCWQKKLEAPASESEILQVFCEKCLKTGNCTPDKIIQNYSRVDCEAIDKSRDFVEVQINKSFERENGCPKGATLESNGSVCQCPAGTTLDNLHSVCLNKDDTKANLRIIVSKIPDDVIEEIADNAPSEIASLIKAVPRQDIDSPLGKLSGLDNMMAEILFVNLIQNTVNLKRLIKTLGSEGTERLIKLLEDILRDEREKAAKALEEAIREENKETSTPPETIGPETQVSPPVVPVPEEPVQPQQKPEPLPEPSHPYFECETSAGCDSTKGFSCHILTIPETGHYGTVCSYQSCIEDACIAVGGGCITYSDSGVSYCIQKK